MKITISKLKELIKEAIIDLNEEERRDLLLRDKRSELDKYVGQLASDTNRDINELMGRLQELFGWHAILEMLERWEDKTHPYYKDLANFAMAYGLAEEEELDIPAEGEVIDHSLASHLQTIRGAWKNFEDGANELIQNFQNKEDFIRKLRKLRTKTGITEGQLGELLPELASQKLPQHIEDAVHAYWMEVLG